jgi:hypothetical protein
MQEAFDIAIHSKVFGTPRETINVGKRMYLEEMYIYWRIEQVTRSQRYHLPNSSEAK